jgi:hypothetical protein
MAGAVAPIVFQHLDRGHGRLQRVVAGAQALERTLDGALAAVGLVGVTVGAAMGHHQDRGHRHSTSMRGSR